MSNPRRIGLLGGSFNPAHDGHLYISLEAIRRLKLDEVWWLVSPQNPLKQASGLQYYAQRLQTAKQLAAPYAKIRVSDLEQRLGTRYTIDTLRRLQAAHPRSEFIWLMGADNLSQFHQWKQWVEILRAVRVVVFDRAPHSHSALRSKAAQRFLRASGAPLRYVHIRRHPLSSTEIRKKTPSMGTQKGV